MAITCRTCSNKVDMKDMKYNKDGTMLICKECYEREHGRKKQKKTVVAKPTVRVFEHYLCERCKYSFKIMKDSKHAKRCPYCAKEDKLVLKKDISVKNLLS